MLVTRLYMITSMYIAGSFSYTDGHRSSRLLDVPYLEQIDHVICFPFIAPFVVLSPSLLVFFSGVVVIKLAVLLGTARSVITNYKLKKFFISAPSLLRSFSRLNSSGANMNWSASVLTTVSSDTEPTIIITFDSAKYIFNAGQNTNRAFLQSRRNWRKTRGIFFTQVGVERAGGLAGENYALETCSLMIWITQTSGLLMTFADATIKMLNVVGPPGLTHYLASMRLYAYR
jgi:hypothetical protein